MANDTGFPVGALAVAVPLFLFASMFHGNTLTAPFADVGQGNFLGDFVEIVTGVADVVLSFVIFDTGFHLPWLFQYVMAIFVSGNLIWALIATIGWQGTLIAAAAEIVALLVGLIPGV